MSKFIKADDIIGTGEVMGLLGCSRQHIYDLCESATSRFPKPFKSLLGGKLWDRTLVVAWRESHGGRYKTAGVLVPEQVEPPQGKAGVPRVASVDMSADERAEVLNRILGS